MSSSYRLVRLRPVDPSNPGKRVYTILRRPGIAATLKFEEVAGWHKLPTATAEVLRDEQDTSGAPVFDVCTHQEAIDLERAEEARKQAKALRAKASSPHDMSHILKSKKASEMPAEVTEAPRPAPRKPAPVAPKVETVAPEQVNWDDLGDEMAHPADDLQDERDDEPAEMETVDLSTEESPVEPAATPTEQPVPVRRGRGRKPQ